ncbi:MAG: VOC family protein [Solirubrobacteraceae bacterium]
MANRTQYTPGTFSWVDLATPDQDGAKAFYTGLFGWEADDQPVGDGVHYSMMNLAGAAVAAISPQPQQQRDAGAPPAWNSYITVESADAALARIQELSGTVHAPAFDVLDVGRMGVAQDPQGAFFLVWEPRRHIGASLVNAPGALCWNELASPDPQASAGFYGELFGWTTERRTLNETEYLVLERPDGEQNGGIRPQNPGEPAHWVVYFGSQDVEADLTRVVELGGRRWIGPMEVFDGSFGVASDPQGAPFAVFAGHFDE